MKIFVVVALVSMLAGCGGEVSNTATGGNGSGTGQGGGGMSSASATNNAASTAFNNASTVRK
jgi:hypothetical protein